jgi:hypothetical protein
MSVTYLPSRVDPLNAFEDRYGQLLQLHPEAASAVEAVGTAVGMMLDDCRLRSRWPELRDLIDAMVAGERCPCAT